MHDHSVQPPMFSVLIATYNHAQYICEALDSVSAQSFADYEIIVVDDGSSDNTSAVVDHWIRNFTARNTQRVVLLRTENGGQSAALEHGIGFSTGKYICLLDSDDRWLATKLEAVRQIAVEQPDAVMICHPVVIMGPAGEATGRIRPSRAKLSGGDLRARVRQTGRSVAAVTSGVVIREDVLQELLPFPTKSFRFGADGYITTGASLRGRVATTDEPLAMYRIHPDGQYFRRMLSEDGPRLAMELHRTIARHLGIEQNLHRSSYFARHVFAERKLHGSAREQVHAYANVLRATLGDDAFTIRARLTLIAFWTASLMAPRRLFLSLWRSFQLRHMGLGGKRL
jgi:glycosyltransferase involved in cell wall biosynthesis